MLKPGMFARISLIVAHKENALSVPEAAIVPQGDVKQVFRIDAENKAQLVPVELGERIAGSVEVLSGLQAGDVVVTSGQIKLQPGAIVSDLSKAKQDAAPEAAAEQAPPAEPAAVEQPAQVAPIAEEPVAEPVAAEPLPTETGDVPPAEPVEEAPAEEGAAQ